MNLDTAPPETPHCMRCEAEKGGIEAAAACSWCEAALHVLCPRHAPDPTRYTEWRKNGTGWGAK